MQHAWIIWKVLSPLYCLKFFLRYNFNIKVVQLPDFFFQLFIHELHSSQQDRHGIIEMVVFMCQKLRNMRHKSKSFKVITLSQNYAKDINYKQHSTCNYYILNLSVVFLHHLMTILIYIFTWRTSLILIELMQLIYVVTNLYNLSAL